MSFMLSLISEISGKSGISPVDSIGCDRVRRVHVSPANATIALIFIRKIFASKLKNQVVLRSRQYDCAGVGKHGSDDTVQNELNGN